jgi:hypothetical protein
VVAAVVARFVAVFAADFAASYERRRKVSGSGTEGRDERTGCAGRDHRK